MLDDLDWELDRRGHRFVRYADDGRIYVGSERAGQRVMESITQYVEQRLKLRVNRRSRRLPRRSKRPLLGFGFFRDGEVKVRVDAEARERAKDRLRRLTTRVGASRWSGGSQRSTASRWLDGLLCAGRYTLAVRGARRVAQTAAQAGPLEGVETFRTKRRNLRALGIPDA